MIIIFTQQLEQEKAKLEQRQREIREQLRNLYDEYERNEVRLERIQDELNF